MESLIAGGAFDALSPDRATTFAVAETILAVAAQAAEARTSGQGGLFGAGPSSVATIRMPRDVHWSIADRMAQEKEAFGFYFSAHPVDRYRHLADQHGARSYGAICDQPPVVEASRSAAAMAGLVEEARWRTSARGRRYLLCTFSDASGQFIASCFDDEVAKDLEEAAKNGGCGLLTVELDRKPGEESPRVTVKRIQPFEALTSNARLELHISIAEPAAVELIAALVSPLRGGRGTLILHASLPDGAQANLCLGRDFLLDAELAARIERMPGIAEVRLRSAEARRLALVS
jgi:DNA polymerase-3 subunit alpha